jgi:hypothetical protein
VAFGFVIAEAGRHANAPAHDAALARPGGHRMTDSAHAADREARMHLLDLRRGLLEVQVAGEGHRIVLTRPEPRGTAMLAAVTGTQVTSPHRVVQAEF